MCLVLPILCHTDASFSLTVLGETEHFQVQRHHFFFKYLESNVISISSTAMHAHKHAQTQTHMYTHIHTIVHYTFIFHDRQVTTHTHNTHSTHTHTHTHTHTNTHTHTLCTHRRNSTKENGGDTEFVSGSRIGPDLNKAVHISPCLCFAYLYNLVHIMRYNCI